MQTPAGDALSKNSFAVYVSYDEDSLRQRRQYMKANSPTFQRFISWHYQTKAKEVDETLL